MVGLRSMQRLDRWGIGASDSLNFVRPSLNEVIECTSFRGNRGYELEGRETSIPHRDVRSQVAVWWTVELYDKSETYKAGGQRRSNEGLVVR